MTGRPHSLRRIIVAATLGAAIGLSGVCRAQTLDQPLSSSPTPPPPAEHYDACLFFPSSIVGGQHPAQLATLLSDRWVSDNLRAEDFNQLASVIESRSRLLQPNRGHDAVRAFLNATIQNLRSGLPIASAARNQRIAYRAAVQQLRTFLLGPVTSTFNLDYGDRLRSAAAITWLLSFKQAQAEGVRNEETFLDLVEPLSLVSGTSLAVALDRFADPDEVPSLFEPELRFTRDVLGLPGGLPTELIVTRALAYSVDLFRESRGERSTLFLDLATRLDRYFSRNPWPSFMPDGAGKPAAFSNRYFLARKTARPAALLADPHRTGADVCRRPT